MKILKFYNRAQTMRYLLTILTVYFTAKSGYSQPNQDVIVTGEVVSKQGNRPLRMYDTLNNEDRVIFFVKNKYPSYIYLVTWNSNDTLRIVHPLEEYLFNQRPQPIGRIRIPSNPALYELNAPGETRLRLFVSRRPLPRDFLFRYMQGWFDSVDNQAGSLAASHNSRNPQVRTNEPESRSRMARDYRGDDIIPRSGRSPDMQLLLEADMRIAEFVISKQTASPSRSNDSPLLPQSLPPRLPPEDLSNGNRRGR